MGMLTGFRKYNRVLLAVFTAFLMVSFLITGTTTRGCGEGGSEAVGEVLGTTVNTADIRAAETRWGIVAKVYAEAVRKSLSAEAAPAPAGDTAAPAPKVDPLPSLAAVLQAWAPCRPFDIAFGQQQAELMQYVQAATQQFGRGRNIPIDARFAESAAKAPGYALLMVTSSRDFSPEPEELVFRIGKAEAARRQGIVVTDRKLEEFLAAIGFTPAALDEFALRGLKLKPEAVREALREDLLIAEHLCGILAGVQVTEAELLAFVRANGDRIALHASVLNAKDFAAKALEGLPSDKLEADLKALYEAHKNAVRRDPPTDQDHYQVDEVIGYKVPDRVIYEALLIRKEGLDRLTELAKADVAMLTPERKAALEARALERYRAQEFLFPPPPEPLPPLTPNPPVVPPATPGTTPATPPGTGTTTPAPTGSTDTKTAPKADPKTDAKTAPKTDAKTDTKANPKPDPKPEAKPAAKPEVKPETKPDPKPAAKPEEKKVGAAADRAARLDGSAGADSVKGDSPKSDTPKGDAAKTDAPKTAPAKSDAPKTDTPKTDPKAAAGKGEAPKSADPKADPKSAAKADPKTGTPATTPDPKTPALPVPVPADPKTAAVPTPVDPDKALKERFEKVKQTVMIRVALEDRIAALVKDLTSPAWTAWRARAGDEDKLTSVPVSAKLHPLAANPSFQPDLPVPALPGAAPAPAGGADRRPISELSVQEALLQEFRLDVLPHRSGEVSRDQVRFPAGLSEAPVPEAVREAVWYGEAVSQAQVEAVNLLFESPAMQVARNRHAAADKRKPVAAGPRTLPLGAVSAPLSTARGDLVLVRLLEAEAEHVPAFDAVREQVVRDLSVQKAYEQLVGAGGTGKGKAHELAARLAAGTAPKPAVINATRRFAARQAVNLDAAWQRMIDSARAAGSDGASPASRMALGAAFAWQNENQALLTSIGDEAEADALAPSATDPALKSLDAFHVLRVRSRALYRVPSRIRLSTSDRESFIPAIAAVPARDSVSSVAQTLRLEDPEARQLVTEAFRILAESPDKAGVLPLPARKQVLIFAVGEYLPVDLGSAAVRAEWMRQARGAALRKAVADYGDPIKLTRTLQWPDDRRRDLAARFRDQLDAERKREQAEQMERMRRMMSGRGMEGLEGLGGLN